MRNKPCENIRIYQLIWHTVSPPIEEPAISPFNVGNAELTMSNTGSEEDVDHLPIPTSRIFSPEFIPAVVALYRDIIHSYGYTDYPERNRI